VPKGHSRLLSGCSVMVPSLVETQGRVSSFCTCMVDVFLAIDLVGHLFDWSRDAECIMQFMLGAAALQFGVHLRQGSLTPVPHDHRPTSSDEIP
jgi:hypothetical protein